MQDALFRSRFLFKHTIPLLRLVATMDRHRRGVFSVLLGSASNIIFRVNTSVISDFPSLSYTTGQRLGTTHIQKKLLQRHHYCTVDPPLTDIQNLGCQ